MTPAEQEQAKRRWRLNSTAWRRAAKRLIDAHRSEFWTYRCEERAKLGLSDA